jgi:hypothetical protein
VGILQQLLRNGAAEVARGAGNEDGAHKKNDE